MGLFSLDTDKTFSICSHVKHDPDIDINSYLDCDSDSEGLFKYHVPIMTVFSPYIQYLSICQYDNMTTFIPDVTVIVPDMLENILVFVPKMTYFTTI